MYTLHLLAEFHEAQTREQAERMLDNFREKVQPGRDHGVTLVRAPICASCEACEGGGEKREGRS